MIATSAPKAEEQYKKRGPADRSSLFMACALLYIRTNDKMTPNAPPAALFAVPDIHTPYSPHFP